MMKDVIQCPTEGAEAVHPENLPGTGSGPIRPTYLALGGRYHRSRSTSASFGKKNKYEHPWYKNATEGITDQSFLSEELGWLDS